MRTIWKYQLQAGEELVISGGSRPQVRHVGVDPAGDPSQPTVWVELDPDTPQVPERLLLWFIGTGHPVPDGEHVGSCVTPAGYVWHVYARRR